jgi:hypothetical protein
VSYNQALFASLGFNYKKSKKLTFVSIIKFKLLERNFEMEFILLLIVVFLSAVSIFLVLLQGIFKYEWISVKIILLMS